MDKLSKEQINEYVVKAQNGDQEAFYIIIENCIGLIEKIKNENISNYQDRKYEISADDLRQDGIIALMGAITRYDPNENAAFTTYAYKCICFAMNKSIRFQLNHLGLTEYDKNCKFMSFDEYPELAEHIESDTSYEIDKIIDKEEYKNKCEKMKNAINKLSELERNIIYMSYGIENNQNKALNYTQIARTLGVTVIAVRKSLINARKKLSSFMED